MALFPPQTLFQSLAISVAAWLVKSNCGNFFRFYTLFFYQISNTEIPVFLFFPVPGPAITATTRCKFDTACCCSVFKLSLVFTIEDSLGEGTAIFVFYFAVWKSFPECLLQIKRFVHLIVLFQTVSTKKLYRILHQIRVCVLLVHIRKR